MKSWPALEVRHLTDAPDSLQAALLDYDVAAIDDNEPDAWRIFFHSAEERERARRGVEHDFPGLSLAPIDVPDEDWAAHSQASLRAIQVGNLIIAPPWDVPRHGDGGSGIGDREDRGSVARSPIPDPRSPLVIVIRPSMGFGTGHHATTRLCLAALQRLDLDSRSAIDVGTGSGVLAIAANRLGASPVVAIDDDVDAVQSARENVALNDGATVDVRLVDVRTATLQAFDLVLANLTGGLLIRAATRLHDVAAPAGRLVLSGFMRHEEAAVLDAFAAFTVAHRAEEEEWLCVTLQRP